ncbi:uncharacterized protein LOC127412498 isoform X3 [Myxocyprinus asiaticus]|uniref:uncharacterized protein LOC127412498 isoform X3 n=1 Tax=Myxocyprinus asiaticus TaxID=70543 RepID=UPI002223C541|nr:uncharacterized protein LOC127412498 isoform X3 [Myxocyprinus asiaticus]
MQVCLSLVLHPLKVQITVQFLINLVRHHLQDFYFEGPFSSSDVVVFNKVHILNVLLKYSQAESSEQHQRSSCKMSTSMVTSPDSSSPKPVTTVSSWIDTSTTTPKSDTTSTTKYTSLSNNTSTTNSASVQAFFEPSENPADHKDSKESSEKRYLWILLPALCILLAALIYLKFMCKKVQHRPEMTDNGTENASFQRTESNKDGVMLLGVNKTAIGEDNTR